MLTESQSVTTVVPCGRLYALYIADSNELSGGINPDGTSKIVEIDESLFFKRTYNRGRLINGQWFKAGVERVSKKTFIVPVENRNTETILSVILEDVLPGTLIYTDNWRAYSSALSRVNGFGHETVNHSHNFVNPDNPDVHTQNIE
jgi:IS1 family transposase